MADLNQIPLWSIPRSIVPGSPIPLPQQQPAMPSNLPPWLQKFRGIVNGIGNRLSGFQPSPYLSPQENDAAQQQARASMAAQLLAASGPHPVGTQGLLQPFGSAMAAGQQAQEGALSNAMQARLLNAQVANAQNRIIPAGAAMIGPDGQPIFQNPVAPTGMNSRFGNPAMTQSGRQVIADRQTGRSIYSDTGQPWDSTKDPLNKVQVITNPDGSTTAINLGSYMSPTQPQAPTTKPVVTSDEAIAGIATKEAAEARAKTLGESQAKAQFDLPRLELNASQAINTLKELRDHPGLAYITGWASKLPIIPDSPQASADALAKQVEGKTFLEAYNTLKGGGQITEIEGNKATAAIARLYRAQSTEDYQKALDDLSSVIQSGLDRAKQQAGAKPSVEAKQPESKKRVKVDGEGNVIQ